MISELPPNGFDKSGEQRILFDNFSFAPDSRTLWTGEKLVPLAPKTCELLAFLLENAGRLLSKEEILNTVWKDVYVEESNLAHHVKVLRRAFGEEKNGQKFIETVPRKGYRFVAPLALRKRYEVVVTERVETRRIEEEIESPENPLIGREREISIIGNILRRRDLRILTLTGPGGSGKTSLARFVSGEAEKDFAGGIFFIDLSSVSAPAQVLAAIAQTLGAAESYAEEIFAALENYLRNKQILLVLDNFEQVIDAAPDISRLVSNLPQLKILVTSRIRLNLKNERELAVLPLAVPGGESTLEELAEYAAVNLFVERARTVKPNFRLTDENARMIAEICRRLEGLPLAVELAAAKIRFLTPRLILEKLEHQLRFLTGGWSDLPSRQQTMRAAIEWSYDLLRTGAEKDFLARLAVFAGGFTLEAAEKIFSDLEKPVEVYQLIDSLTDQNLLIAGESSDGDVRYRTLETIREFALEKLSEADCRARTEQHHAAYYLRLAEELEPQIRSRKANEIYQKFKTEHDNLRVALDYFRTSDPEKYLRLATATGLFWSTHALFSEGRARIEEALRLAAPNSSPPRALANKAAAIIAHKQGDYAAAEKFHLETLRIAEVLRNEKLQATAFNGLGTVAYLRGDFVAAQNYFERGLEISRRLNDEELILPLLVGLAEAKRIEGDWENVRLLNEESLIYINRRGLKRPFVGAQLNLGVVAFMEGDFKEAQKFFQIARELVQPDDRQGISLCLDGFAALAVQRGESERAMELAAEADRMRYEIGYRLELPDQMFRDYYIKGGN